MVPKIPTKIHPKSAFAKANPQAFQIEAIKAAIKDREDEKEDATVQAINRLTEIITKAFKKDDANDDANDSEKNQKNTTTKNEKHKNKENQDWNEMMEDIDEENMEKQAEEERRRRSQSSIEQLQLVLTETPENSDTSRNESKTDKDDHDHETEKIEKIIPTENKTIKKLIEKITQIKDQMELQRTVINTLQQEVNENKKQCKSKHQPKNQTWAEKTKPQNQPLQQNTHQQNTYQQQYTNTQPPPTTPYDDDRIPLTDKEVEDDYLKQETKNRRNRKKFLPTVGISPGYGEHDTEENVPGIAFAKTTYKHLQKQPKIDIPEEALEKFPEIENNNDDQNSYAEKLSDQGKKKLEDITNDSKLKIGFKPITTNMIKNELENIRQTGQVNIHNYNDMMITATKNVIIKFMKNHLQMDEKTRNSIEIT